MNHVDWQLGNWIRSSQQNSCAEGNNSVSESPAHKQPPPSQSSKQSSLEVVEPVREPEPRLSSQQTEVTESLGKPQKCSESPQDGLKLQSSQTPPSADLNSCSRKLSCTTNSSKPSKAGCAEAAVDMKCEEVVATRARDPCVTDRPKVKTKTGHSKRKDRSGAKKDGKRPSKQASLDKQKSGSEPEAALVPSGHCPLCGKQYPNPCSCPTQSPAQPDQLSPAAPVKTSCSRPKSESICQKSTKIPQKTAHKHPEKTGQAAKSSRDPHRPLRSLLVKFDLSLLSKVPQASGSPQETLGTAKRSALVVEKDGRGSDASTTRKLAKTSKKNIPQNVRKDEGLFLSCKK